MTKNYYHGFAIVETKGAPTMPVHRFVNPASMAKPPGYTQVVEAATPGRIVYIAGQLGLDLDNKIVGAPGDFRAQAEQTFINVKNALAAVGAGFEHVLKLNNYLMDMTHLGIFREVRDRYIDPSAPPASTTIAIANLARPGALLEVEAVAIIPAKTATKASAKTTRGKALARSGAKPAKKAVKSKAGSRKRK
jgi:2-iminobutanoate/2-iminopropanoate deaminase